MTVHNVAFYKDLILADLKSSNDYRKNTIALAFKYICDQRVAIQDISILIEPFLNLLSSPNQNVKKAVLTSLNSIVLSMPKFLDHINPSFEASLADACKFKPELLKEIELGPFKYVSDEGLATRSLAFSFIDIGLNYLLEKLGINYIVDQALIGISKHLSTSFQAYIYYFKDHLNIII